VSRGGPAPFPGAYSSDGFADTTASRAELERLARNMAGPADDAPYRYRRPSDDDDAPLRPCNYPPTLDDALRPGLRQAETWDQARAVVEVLACQMSQTGFAGRRRATPEEREWGHLIYAASRARQQLRRVPGTCRGCNSNPCRCVA
jgi:hypothetical protein